jgi:hypothetical protein
VPPIIVLWLFFGWLFTLSYFDNHLGTYKLLDGRGDALTYISLLFAVQIPLFILLLERMTDLGYVRRLILPGVIKFREVLVSYVILSFLLLLSSRASFYYFPVITLTILSLYTIFIAVRVLFEQRKLKDKETSFVKGIVTQVFKDVLVSRKEGNDFFEKLKELSRVTHIFTDMAFRYQDVDSISIRTEKVGLVTRINISNLEELLSQYATDSTKQTDIPSDASDDSKSEKHIVPRVILSVRPGASVKSQEVLMKVIFKQGATAPDKNLESKLRKQIHIEPDKADTAGKQLDDLTEDFKQQLRDTIDKDNEITIKQSLEFYSLLLDGLTTFSKEVADSGYSFKDAKQEFHQFIGDSVSEQIKSISDILNDEFLHAIRDEKRDTAKELTSFIYGEMLRVMHDYDTLRAAFADNAMVFAINRIIYADNALLDSPFKDEVLDSLAFRLKEHTDLLLYNYRNIEDSESMDKAQIEEWLGSRIDDVRGFLLASYKKSNSTAFKQILQVYEEIEEDYQHYEDEVKELGILTRCNIFIVAAYMHNGSNDDDQQKECRVAVRSMLSKWSYVEITEILVKCIDENYSGKWSVDMFDLVADGNMHSVPDFAARLKELWADMLLANKSFSDDVGVYEAIPNIQSTFSFSDGMSNTNDAFLVKYLDEIIGRDEEVVISVDVAQRLKNLVVGFIDLRRNWENEKLVAAPLSEEKVSKFRDDILKGYKERSLANSLFQKTNKLTFVQRANNKFLTFGWNQIHDKEAFIDDWHAGYFMRGEEYGSEIATRENQIITENLFANPTTISNFDDWLSKVKDGSKNEWFILGNDVASWFLHQQYEDYLVKDKPYNDVFFSDVLQMGKVEHLYGDNLPKGLYAVKVKDIGELKVKQKDSEPVEVTIKAYSHDTDMLGKILDEPPEWLIAKGDRNAQEAFLKTRVLMFINHPFRYIAQESAKVYYFALDEDA